MDLNYSKEKIRRVMNENRKKGEEIAFLRRRLDVTSQELTQARDDLESTREKYIATEAQLRNTLFELFGLQEENGKLQRQLERTLQSLEEMKTLQSIQEEKEEPEIFDLQITQPVEHSSEEHVTSSEEHLTNPPEKVTLVEIKRPEVVEQPSEVKELTSENVAKSYWLVNGWW